MNGFNNRLCLIAVIIIYSCINFNPAFSQKTDYPDFHSNSVVDQVQSTYSNGFPDQLEYKIFGTGETTGIIMNIVVHNPTDKPIYLTERKVIFPRVDDSQAYIGLFPGDTSQETLRIDPGETDTIPAVGECLDVRKYPLGDGVPGPEISRLITEENTTLFPEPGSTIPEGFVEIDPDQEELVIINPTTNEAVPFHIDFGKAIEPAASLIFEIDKELESTFERLFEEGAYDHLPIPETRILNEMPQLSKWHTYAILQGEPYTEEEFSERLDSQLITQIQMPISELPEKTQNDWSEGKKDIFSMVSFTGKEAKVVKENVFHIKSETDGLVFQAKECDWLCICIDFFIFTRKDGNEYTIEPVYTNQEGRFLQRSASIPENDFNLANGAMADLTGQEYANQLTQNLNQMLSRINTIYEPCCIWFEVNKIYAIDPAKAVASDDGTKLDRWVDMENEDPEWGPDPEMDVESEIQTENGNLTMLRAAERFVENHSGLGENDCLKMFLGPSFAGEDAPAGVGNERGAFSVIPLSRIRPNCSGCVPSHEIGHNLGLDHDHSDNNVMNEREPSGPGMSSIRPENIKISEDQCDIARERAEAIGDDCAPPPPSEDENPEPLDESEGQVEPTEGTSQSPDEPSPPSQPEDDEDEEECECPDPEVYTAELEDLSELEVGQQASGESTVRSCCADVSFSVEVEKTARSRFSYSWDLKYKITDPNCFVSFDLNRFYVSKKFDIWFNGVRNYELPVSQVEFTTMPDGSFKLRTNEGFELNYESLNFNQSQLRNARRWFTRSDQSLNSEEDARYWQVLIGGMIKCKDGDEIKEIPFHFIFRNRSRTGSELSGDASTLRDSEIIGGTAREGITRESIYRDGQ